MSVSDGIYEVRCGGEKCGTVSVQKSGQYSVFRCRCVPPDASVFRLCAVCGGETIPLGVPVPENGFLCLKRSVSETEQARLGLRSPDYFVLVIARSDWKPYGRGKGWLAKNEAGTTLVAVPLHRSEPFPLMEVFCFGAPETINGSTYLVFDEDYLRLGMTSIQ